MSDYSNLLKLFQQLEPLQKETELVAKGLDAAALNETRNATYHLLIGLCDSTKCEKEIEKAVNHAKRAIYDCHEAILLNELEKFKVFKENYKNVVVTDVVSDYIEKCGKAKSAMDKITEIRKADVQHANDYVNKYSPDRNKQYEDIAPYLEVIKENNLFLEQARTELNKIIRKESKDKFWAFLGKIGAVLVAVVMFVIAVLAWWYPRTPT